MPSNSLPGATTSFVCNLLGRNGSMAHYLTIPELDILVPELIDDLGKPQTQAFYYSNKYQTAKKSMSVWMCVCHKYLWQQSAVKFRAYAADPWRDVMG
jgi:hypothetical protein